MREECELLRTDMNKMTDARLKTMEEGFLQNLKTDYKDHFKRIEDSVKADMSQIREEHRTATANLNKKIDAFRDEVARMEATKRDSRKLTEPPTKQPSGPGTTPAGG